MKMPTIISLHAGRQIRNVLAACGLGIACVAASATPPPPRPTVAVVDFTNDAANATWFHGSVGEQLADVLSNELASTGDFDIVERGKLDAVLNEQDLARSGRVRAGSGPVTGDITGARYLITGEVAAYTENTADTGGGVSVYGFHVGGGKSEAYVAIDLRVIDAETSEVVYARTVEGRSTDHDVNVGGYVGWGVGGDFHHGRKVPVGKAVRAALVEASNYLDCVMVQRDGCIEVFRQKEQRRRRSDSDVLDLD